MPLKVDVALVPALGVWVDMLLVLEMFVGVAFLFLDESMPNKNLIPSQINIRIIHPTGLKNKINMIQSNISPPLELELEDVFFVVAAIICRIVSTYIL